MPGLRLYDGSARVVVVKPHQQLAAVHSHRVVGQYRDNPASFLRHYGDAIAGHIGIVGRLLVAQDGRPVDAIDHAERDEYYREASERNKAAALTRVEFLLLFRTYLFAHPKFPVS